MKQYVKVLIDCTSEEQADMYIALLSEEGYYAFEQEANALAAYIEESDFDSSVLGSIVPEASVLSVEKIDDTNWNARWESDYNPVEVGNFAIIRAHFHEVPSGIKHDLLITPKMSFGTGHHATTWLMIAQMEHMDFSGKSVLDFGTGTGVLAILAEKLGAKEVLAIDLDDWSIENTKENATQNNCKHIRVEKRDSVDGYPQQDIILANINLNILSLSATALSTLQSKGGMLLVSGFLNEDVPAIKSVFTAQGYQKENLMAREQWASVLFKKK